MTPPEAMWLTILRFSAVATFPERSRASGGTAMTDRERSAAAMASVFMGGVPSGKLRRELKLSDNRAVINHRHPGTAIDPAPPLPR